MTYKPYLKRDAIKNYFLLPNELFALGLSIGEISVYSYLLYRENRKTFQCHPSYKTIGRAIRKSENAVRKYVAGLVEKRLITTAPTTIRTKRGEVRNGNLLYTVRPMQAAIDYHNECQLAKLDAGIEKQRVAAKLAAQR